VFAVDIPFYRTSDLSGIAGQIGGVTSGDYRVVQLALKVGF